MADDTFRWVVAGGVILAALSMLTTAILAVIAYRTLSRIQGKVTGLAERAEPVVDSVRYLIDSNTGKIGNIVTATQDTVGNVKDISAIAVDQSRRFAEVGRDIADRTKVQVARVDAAVDKTVEHVHHLGENVKTAVMKPVGEFNALMAGIRAGLSAYARGQRPSVARVTQDEEMFI
jgi:hypothetical protein